MHISFLAFQVSPFAAFCSLWTKEKLKASLSFVEYLEAISGGRLTTNEREESFSCIIHNFIRWWTHHPFFLGTKLHLPPYCIISNANRRQTKMEKSIYFKKVRRTKKKAKEWQKIVFHLVHMLTTNYVSVSMVQLGEEKVKSDFRMRGKRRKKSFIESTETSK